LSYVKELRRVVGTKALVLAGSSVIIEDSSGQVLLQRRSDTGHWGFPGGFMEPGETLEEAARREVREETGVDIQCLEFLRVFSGPELFHRYPNGDEVFNVTALYLSQGSHLNCSPVADGCEGSECRFFRLDDLPGEISPPQRSVLEWFLAYRST